MAEQSSAALKEQLTCSVCLDQYTNPKTLQCHHSFCLKCIKVLPLEQQVRRTNIRKVCMHTQHKYWN